MVDKEQQPVWEQPAAAPPPGYPGDYPPGYYPPPYYPAAHYPPPYGYLPPHLKPSSNIGWAIGALFTLWPLAIPAFIAALKVDDLWFRGDAFGANKASADARKFGIIAVSLFGGFFVLLILIGVLLVAVGGH
ncbi:MAG: CD225/dispanin family protein [Jatrophihabitans sp.]